eukprot:m.111167 g.111167  ORF g.111167 m.111167 type:complete len:243 (+) comp9232_c4_seq2:4257-4985(+)
MIGGVPSQDFPIYASERYALESFKYSLDMPSKSGNYILALLFSEVYFRSPNAKVFDVLLNDMNVVSNLDIYANVGFSSAFNRFVPFSVKDGLVFVDGVETDYKSLEIEFAKGIADNPKVCGIAIVEGSLQDAEELFPIFTSSLPEPEMVDEMEAMEEMEVYDMNEEEEEEVHHETPKFKEEAEEVLVKHAEKKSKTRKQPRRTQRKAESEGQLPLVPIFIGIVIVFAVWKFLFSSDKGAKQE